MSDNTEEYERYTQIADCITKHLNYQKKKGEKHVQKHSKELRMAWLLNGELSFGAGT